jgi:hypothetical protein
MGRSGSSGAGYPPYDEGDAAQARSSSERTGDLSHSRSGGNRASSSHDGDLTTPSTTLSSDQLAELIALGGVGLRGRATLQGELMVHNNRPYLVMRNEGQQLHFELDVPLGHVRPFIGGTVFVTGTVEKDTPAGGKILRARVSAPGAKADPWADLVDANALHDRQDPNESMIMRSTYTALTQSGIAAPVTNARRLRTSEGDLVRIGFRRERRTDTLKSYVLGRAEPGGPGQRIIYYDDGQVRLACFWDSDQGQVLETITVKPDGGVSHTFVTKRR